MSDANTGSVQSISIPSHKLKELFTLCQYLWVRFQVIYKEEITENLRFIEFERKIDSFTNVNELILELDVPETTLDKFAALIGRSFRVSFVLEGSEFYFTTNMKDILVLMEKIPVLILDWPEKVFKKRSRMSERVNNLLEDELNEDYIYVRDISIGGCSLVFRRNMPFTVGQLIENVTVTVPAMRHNDDARNLRVTYHALKVNLRIMRESLYRNRFRLFGCKFEPAHIRGFLMIRQYVSVRQKEEDFFKKNHYYPDITLPPIKISQDVFNA